MIKNRIFYISIFISAILSSCMHQSNLNKYNNSNYKTISNEGIICLKKPNKNRLYIAYYPLSKSCESSSKISWKLLGFDTNINNQILHINSYALYKRRYPQIATTDCAGAGIKSKTISIPSSYTIYWGKQKLINTNKISSKICFLKKKNNLKIINSF